MFKNYFILTLKVLARRKFFTFISLFGISFTLMVLMIVTAFLEHKFAPGKPESLSDRTLLIQSVQMRSEQGWSWSSSPSYYFYQQYLQNLPKRIAGIERISFATNLSANKTYLSGQALDVRYRGTDAHYWSIFDLDVLDGRTYNEEEVADGAQVAVITQALSHKLFGEGKAIGQTVLIEKKTYQVIGIVQNTNGLQWPNADMWVPYTAKTSAAALQSNSYMGDAQIFVLLGKGVDKNVVINEWTDITKNEMVFDGPQKEMKTLAAPMVDKVEEMARNFFNTWDDLYQRHGHKLITAIAIGYFLFMMLPALNLINVNISRIMERASEIGVRKAFGASASDLIIQFVIENVFLTLIGGLLGFALASLMMEYLNSSELIAHLNLRPNWTIGLAGLGLSLLFGLLSGVYPAWRMSKLPIVEALKL